MLPFLKNLLHIKRLEVEGEGTGVLEDLLLGAVEGGTGVGGGMSSSRVEAGLRGSCIICEVCIGVCFVAGGFILLLFLNICLGLGQPGERDRGNH